MDDRLDRAAEEALIAGALAGLELLVEISEGVVDGARLDDVVVDPLGGVEVDARRVEVRLCRARPTGRAGGGESLRIAAQALLSRCSEAAQT